MGNIALSACFIPNPQPMVKLVFWGGTMQFLPANTIAGDLMFQYPDRIVCHADSFYVGHPVPALAIEDELLAGNTYFILPVDRLPCKTLTTAALASLSSSKEKPSLAGSKVFKYLKGSDGRMLIKLVPEFIVRVISSGEGGDMCREDSMSLCTTPELKKHYAALVPKERPWSPKLDPISEKKKRNKGRLSPSMLICCLQGFVACKVVRVR